MFSRGGIKTWSLRKDLNKAVLIKNELFRSFTKFKIRKDERIKVKSFIGRLNLLDIFRNLDKFKNNLWLKCYEITKNPKKISLIFPWQNWKLFRSLETISLESQKSQNMKDVKSFHRSSKPFQKLITTKPSMKNLKEMFTFTEWCNKSSIRFCYSPKNFIRLFPFSSS